jgi:hypothetical protein
MNGDPCGAAALVGEELCLWHHPDHTEEVAEARRLGGVNRRRERIVFAANDYEGLGSVQQIRRLLELAVSVTLQQQHSIAQARTLAYLAQQGLKMLEVGEIQDRLDALESVLGDRLKKGGRS